MIGGGYLVARAHQGTVHNGTIACIVTREGSYYALTNRHVTGLGAEVIKVYVRGRRHRIGRCSDIGLTELKFSDAFPAWPGERTYLTLDAGLMRIDDITDWTAQAFGIGEIGVPFDATEQTVTLDMISCPVRAFGGVSGVIEGEIRALFFRYESLGGIDRVTDVLIGPRTENKRPTVSRRAAVHASGRFRHAVVLRSADIRRHQSGCRRTAPARARPPRPPPAPDRHAVGRRAVSHRRRKEQRVRARDVRVDNFPRARRRAAPRLEHRTRRVLGENRPLCCRLESVRSRRGKPRHADEGESAVRRLRRRQAR